MHSKLLVDPSDSIMWKKTLNEANGVTERATGPLVEDLIHTIPSSYIDRIRLIKRRGLRKSIYYRIIRESRKLFSR